jgi:hypothetical protein
MRMVHIKIFVGFDLQKKGFDVSPENNHVYIITYTRTGYSTNYLCWFMTAYNILLPFMTGDCLNKVAVYLYHIWPLYLEHDTDFKVTRQFSVTCRWEFYKSGSRIESVMVCV